MELRTKRDAHPGYAQTGGPPRDKSAKTKKELAAEEKADKAAKAKAKEEGYKKIAALEKANATAFVVDDTPRAAPKPKGRGKGKANGKAKAGKKRLPSPSPTPEPTPEPESDRPSGEEEASEDGNDDEEESHESDADVPDPDDEHSEPPSDLEKTIKKKTKGKPSVRQLIDKLKEDDMDVDEDEGPTPQETPMVSRSKRLRAESAPQDSAMHKKAKVAAVEDPQEPLSPAKPKPGRKEAGDASTSKKKAKAPVSEDEEGDVVEVTNARKVHDGKRKKQEVAHVSEPDEDDSDEELPSRVLVPGSYQKRPASASEVGSADPDSWAMGSKDKRSEVNERADARPHKDKRSEKERASDIQPAQKKGPAQGVKPKPSNSSATGKDRDQGAAASKPRARENSSEEIPQPDRSVDRRSDGKRQTSTVENKDDATSNAARSRRNGESKHASVERWAKTIQPNSQPAKGSESSSRVPSLSRSAKTSSSQASFPQSARSALSSQVAVKTASGKRRRNDDEEPAVGGLSDHDELDGEEYEDARDSPVKGNRRANSNAIIAVKKTSQGSKVKSKEPKPPRKRPSNRAIPSDCHVDDAWTKKVIPTLISWVGCQRHPWYPDPERLLDALEIICAEVYGEDVVEKIPLDSQKDEPYILVTQRLKDRWRNKISSSAASILISFFENDPESDLAHSNEARATYAAWALEDSRFCYAKAKFDEPKRWRGAFQGALVILAFSAHWNCVQDCLEIDDLESDFGDGRPRGALAIACSAMRRALMLWRDGGFTIEAVQQAKETGTAIKVQARLNKSTGKATGSYAAFSATLWKDNTNDYLKNIMGLSTEAMDEIIEQAKTAAAKARKAEDGSTAMTEEEQASCEVVIRDGSGSEEESEDDEEDVPQWRKRGKPQSSL